MGLIRRFQKAAAIPLVAVAFLLSACAQTALRLPDLPRLPLARPAQTGPAIWVVRDADSTLYLFGTVHVLKPDQDWRSPRLDQAFESADELVLEIAEVGDDAAMMPLVARYGLDPGVRLSSKLTPADKARLDAAAAAMGANPASFEPMRPWLVSLQLTVGSLARAGYGVDSGVDRALKARAQATGKRIRAFETPEQQLRFFADLEPAVELALLRQALAEFDSAPTTFEPLSRGWLEGDLGVLRRYLIDDWARGEPALYRVLIVDRNAAWADQIEATLRGSGTSFIAVGAGHLVGPDSVQAQLRRKGIASQRF